MDKQLLLKNILFSLKDSDSNENIHSLEELNLSREEKMFLLNLIFISPKYFLISVWKMNLSETIKYDSMYEDFSLNKLYNLLFSSKEDFIYSLRVFLKNQKKFKKIEELNNFLFS